MTLKTIGLAAAFTLVSSLAFAQAPIGSSATSGNAALINRGPVNSVGEDMDFRLDRSGLSHYQRPAYVERHYRHRRVYHDWR